MSCARGRSRKGSSAISASICGTAASCSPSASLASIPSSSAVSRASWSPRRCSTSTSCGRSANAAPRQSASARSTPASAAAYAPAASLRRAPSRRSAKREASTDAAAMRSEYAFPCVATVSGPSRRRSACTCTCNALTARSGGCSPHIASIARSRVTTPFGSSASSASSARCFGPPSRSATPFACTSMGPSSRISIAAPSVRPPTDHRTVLQPLPAATTHASVRRRRVELDVRPETIGRRYVIFRQRRARGRFAGRRVVDRWEETMRKRIGLGLCVATVAAAIAAASSFGSVATAALCGSLGAPPATFAHVIWIFMENHRYSGVIGAPGTKTARHAPFINGTLVPECGLATNYHAIRHPSLPNYIAPASGASQLPLNCVPANCPQTGTTIFDQEPSWRVYAEDMPSNCYPVDSGLYAGDHNAPAYYPSLASACQSNDLPFGTATSGAFVDDLNAGTLPALSIVLLNSCDSMESCTVSSGDAWLQTWIPKIVAAPNYQQGGTAIFLTWDEGNHGSRGEICADNLTDESCHVAMLVLSPYTKPGTTDATLYSHYSLLRTTEELLGIGTYLGEAASANSMRTAFGL